MTDAIREQLAKRVAELEKENAKLRNAELRRKLDKYENLSTAWNKYQHLKGK